MKRLLFWVFCSICAASVLYLYLCMGLKGIAVGASVFTSAVLAYVCAEAILKDKGGQDEE